MDQEEHIENIISSHYILGALREGIATARRQGNYRMCGRFTVKATWAELVALYRLTMDAPPHNLRPHYNVCPTDPVDLVRAEEGQTRARFDALGPDPRVGGAKPSKTRRWRRSTLGQRRSRRNPSFVTRSSGRAASSRCQATTNGRRRAANSRGISLREMAHHFSQRPDFGTSGKTAGLASG